MNGTWDSVTTMLNAGIDMFMIPGWRGLKAVQDVIIGYKEGLKNGTINEDRINDAVARIISVKIAMGLAKVIPNSLQEEEKAPEAKVEIIQEQPRATTEYE